MTPIAYFKLQAKNLNRDIKTQFFNEEDELLDYKPRFFDVNDIVVMYDLDERDPKFKTLGKAQWIIAMILGLRSWHELIHSDPVSLELYKLMIEHQNEITPDEWDDMFIIRTMDGDVIVLDEPSEKLEHYKLQLETLKEPWAMPSMGHGHLLEKETDPKLN